MGPVWLSGGEEGFYASALFLGLLAILAWGVQRRFRVLAPIEAAGFIAHT